jgi:hypothetical protein
MPIHFIVALHWDEDVSDNARKIPHSDPHPHLHPHLPSRSIMVERVGRHILRTSFSFYIVFFDVFLVFLSTFFLSTFTVNAEKEDLTDICMFVRCSWSLCDCFVESIWYSKSCTWSIDVTLWTFTWSWSNSSMFIIWREEKKIIIMFIHCRNRSRNHYQNFVELIMIRGMNIVKNSLKINLWF